MRILLCQSYLGVRRGEPLVFPLGLAYIASMVKENHELYCWDPNDLENPFGELPGIISKFDPDVVGVSLRNIDNVFSFNKRSHYAHFVAMIKIIRKHAPLCKLVAGGTGFSIFAEKIMRNNPDIDIGVVSEGEKTFADLMENLDQPQRVKNLIFRREGSLSFTGKRESASFDDLPVPLRELFDLRKYSKQAFSIVFSLRGAAFSAVYSAQAVLFGAVLSGSAHPTRLLMKLKC